MDNIEFIRDIEEYENTMTNLLMQYKEKLDNGIITYNEVDALISVLMEEVICKVRIIKSLNYAWNNSGETLIEKENKN